MISSWLQPAFGLSGAVGDSFIKSFQRVLSQAVYMPGLLVLTRLRFSGFLA